MLSGLTTFRPLIMIISLWVLSKVKKKLKMNKKEQKKKKRWGTQKSLWVTLSYEFNFFFLLFGSYLSSKV